MKSPEVDPLLSVSVGGLALLLEAGLRIAGGVQKQLLTMSAESKKFLGARTLPVLEER